MRFYISGPMTGLPGWNHEAFNEVEEAIDQHSFGIVEGDLYLHRKVTNPARNFDGCTDLPREQYLALDIQQVCEADVIVLLKGWETSDGSNLEVDVAKATGKRFVRATRVGALWQFFEIDAGEIERVRGTQAAGNLREFATGATRDVETGKLDYEGFLSPAVLEAYAAYMDKHRVQSDGNVRPADNWQKGIPRDVYMKSMWRHFMDVWKAHRGQAISVNHVDALMALMFNVQGYTFELLREAGRREADEALEGLRRKLAGDDA